MAWSSLGTRSTGFYDAGLSESELEEERVLVVGFLQEDVLRMCFMHIIGQVPGAPFFYLPGYLIGRECGGRKVWRVGACTTPLD